MRRYKEEKNRKNLLFKSKFGKEYENLIKI